MRKVEEEMLRALWQGRTWSKGNTRVDGEGNVFLHGNHIARNVTMGSFEYRWAGWRTRTTASRLRAILQWTSVNNKREVPYIICAARDDAYAWRKLPEEGDEQQSKCTCRIEE